MGWYLNALVNFADFGGRASRSEYWWFFLFNFFIAIALVMLTAPAQLPTLVYLAAIIIPTFSVTVRRLHDTDRSGWWLLVSFVPFGGLLLLFFYILPGTPGTNQYGPEFRTSSGGPSQRVTSRQTKVQGELMRLYQLQKSGAMSHEEYQAQRRALLSRL